MKHFGLLLVLGALVLCIFGAKAGHAHANLLIRNCNQDCTEFSTYLPCDDIFKNGDVSKNLGMTQANFASNPFYKNLSVIDYLKPPSQEHYSCLGLGCGGLPS
jgi:hypothetical protein